MVARLVLGILWIGMSEYQPGPPIARVKEVTAQAVLENKSLAQGAETILRGVINGTAPAALVHQTKNHKLNINPNLRNE